MMNTDSLTGQVSVKTSISGNTPGIKGEKGNGIESTILNDDYTLTLNYTNGTSDTTPSIRGEKGEKGDNGISPSITTTKSGKVTTITIEDATGTKTATINDGIDSQGDMLKSTYDKNSNGIVDNSEKVNGYTVETNVPSDAKFTDTIYTHPDTSGNKHIPSGGVSGQILKWDEDGTAKWDDSVEAHREGTELKINNYKGLIKFTKEGKSTQETRSGKNLLRFNSSTQTVNGLTITINNDGIITLDGTTTSVVSIKLSTSMYNLKAGTYYLSRNATGSVSNTFTNILYGNNGTPVNIGSLTSEGMIVTATTDYQEYYLWLYINSGITFTNYTMKPQLETGTVKTDWEQYGASPSPDYPSEIISIPSVENLFDKDNANYIKGYITGNGSIWVDKNDNVNKTFYISIKPNTTYTISKKSEKRFRVSTFSSIPTVTTQGNVSYNNNTSSSCTITTGNNDNYLFVYYYDYNDYTLTEQEILDSIMIEEDSKAHPYVPFGNYLRIDNVGKNLFDKDNANILNALLSSGGTLTSGNQERTFYIRCLPNTTYTISKIAGKRLRVDERETLPTIGSSNINLKINDTSSSLTYTTSSSGNYLLVSYLYTGGDTLTEQEILDSIQIEQGSRATECEPYRNKVIYVNMQDKKLCSNKDETIKDKLIIYDNGKTEINKKIGEVVLDGSESGWNKTYSSSGVTQFYISLPNAIAQGKLISTHFINATEENKAYINKYGQLVIINPFNNDTSLVEWKTWLSNNPVKIQYELAEPETIDLGITDFNLLEGNSELTCEDESNMQLDYLTIDSNIFVQDSLDGNSSKKAPSVRAVNEIISQLEARIIELESKNV